MKKRTFIILFILAIIAIGGFIGYKMWNKPFADPVKGEAIKVTAIQLFNDFSTNEAAAQKKYVPQKLGETVIEVSGDIKEAGRNDGGETFYYLNVNVENSGVKCIMDTGEKLKETTAGNTITVRGFCDGVKKDSLMDMVLMDVIVSRCKWVR